MATENRITIFTKNSSSKFGGRALILDLTRSLNHTYNSVVAKHPIEGAGYSVADHAYPKNIIVGITGHVSNAVKPPQGVEADNYDAYGLYRNEDAYKLEVENTIQVNNIDYNEISGFTDGQILTQSEADLLNKYKGLRIDWEVGEAFDGLEQTALLQSMQNSREYMQDIPEERNSTTNSKRAVDGNKNLRPVYNTDRMSKQLDAFEFLEAIRNERLLCDILTTAKLYRDMFMASLNLPRTIGVGCALEVSMTFEQQRFAQATRTILSARKEDIITQKSKGKDQGTEAEPSELGRWSPILKRFTGSIKGE